MAALSVASAASATPTGTTSSPSVASRTGGAGRSNAMRRPSSCLATLPRHGSPIVATPPEHGHVGVEEMDDVRERVGIGPGGGFEDSLGGGVTGGD